MDILQRLSHHAYLLIGSNPLRADLISILETAHDIRVQGNADFFDQAYENFVIDDARHIKSLHGTRPMSESGKKIFIITTNGITVEAQNALLKLLEEPAEYAHFFLIVPSAHLLLPTMRSRMSMVTKSPASGTPFKKGDTDSEIALEVQKFIKLSPAKRLEVVKKLVEDITKEKKTKQDAIDFVDALQANVYEEKGIKEGQRELEAIDTARKYLNDRAPSVKMLLEYVALNV